MKKIRKKSSFITDIVFKLVLDSTKNETDTDIWIWKQKNLSVIYIQVIWLPFSQTFDSRRRHNREIIVKRVGGFSKWISRIFQHSFDDATFSFFFSFLYSIFTQISVTGRIYIVHVMSMYILTVTITTLYVCAFYMIVCVCLCVCLLFPLVLGFPKAHSHTPHVTWVSTPHRRLRHSVRMEICQTDSPVTVECVYVLFVCHSMSTVNVCVCHCVCGCMCVWVHVWLCHSYNLVFYLII